MLLGAPLSVGPAMDVCLAERCTDLTRAAVSAHDALLLLKSCLSASKLRSAHCEGHDLLHTFDDLQRSLLCGICNVSLTDDQWLQASLPVRNGGLGVRMVHRLPRRLSWHWLLELVSSRTSFLVGGQVWFVMLTSSGVWPVDSIQICPRASLLVDRRNGTRSQCRKNTVSCLHVTQSRAIGHDCLQLHPITVATGYMPCRLLLVAYISTMRPSGWPSV